MERGSSGRRLKALRGTPSRKRRRDTLIDVAFGNGVFVEAVCTLCGWQRRRTQLDRPRRWRRRRARQRDDLRRQTVRRHRAGARRTLHLTERLGTHPEPQYAHYGHSWRETLTWAFSARSRADFRGRDYVGTDSPVRSARVLSLSFGSAGVTCSFSRDRAPSPQRTL